MLIAFFVLASAFALILAFPGKRYHETVRPLDAGKYRLKSFLPAGMLVLDAFKYKYTTSYDRRLFSAIVELSGHREALFYLKVHWSGKIVLLLFALIFAAFVGAFTKPDAGYAFFCTLLVGSAVYLTDKDLFDRVKKRRFAIQMDFPDFVNKLTLLINAGMTVTKAWEKVAAESRKEFPLYLELSLALQEIKSGVPEYKAYEEFAKRCRVPEITRFISVILQNLRKGSSELVPILRVFAGECWEMRKNAAKKFGEEASTKLLLPMMLMFIAILLIVGTPAVLALRNI